VSQLNATLGHTSYGADQTLVGAVWRFRWLAAAITAVFGLGSLLLVVFRPAEFVAVAAVLLEEPGAANVLSVGSPLSAERQVANQLEVFRSGAVAARASEIARESGVSLSAGSILRSADIANVRATDVITIRFAAGEERTAAVVVSSVLEAYQDVRDQQRRREADLVLGRLDSAEEVLRRQLRQVQADIAATKTRRGFDGKIDAVLDQLAEQADEIATEADADRRAELLAEQDEYERQLAALRLGSELEAERADLAALIRSQDDILDRLSDLANRKSEVEIEAGGAGSGIAFVSSPAVTESNAGAGKVFTLVAGLFLGALLALGVTYALASRVRVFASPNEPEGVFGVSLLAEVPKFDDAEVLTMLPVRDQPRGLAAEAFRFAASSLEFRVDHGDLSAVMVVSATVGDGKSTVVANTAMAAARSGKRVVALDADFGNQALSHLLLGEVRLGTGLTEVVTGQASIAEAVIPVEVVRGTTFDLIGRGALPAIAVDFFASKDTQSAIRRLRDVYDLVIIDGPPILQVAYASTLARLADSVVVVVKHGSSIRLGTELARRLAFIGSNTIGYLYNEAPPRPGLADSGGSMKDVLGDQGFQVPVPPRPRS
jgi:Mrp family chromosome partitioning ATPase